MVVQLANLNFRAYSPSWYELLSISGNSAGDRVHICYAGSGRWLLVYEAAGGRMTRRLFNSRDAVVDMLTGGNHAPSL